METKFTPYEESLKGNRKLINRLKKTNIEMYNPRGDWNGYGYTRLPLVAVISTEEENQIFNEIKQALANEPKPKKKTEQEKLEAWARSLVRKLQGTEYELTYDGAIRIALEKKEALSDSIAMLECRQTERYSPNRQKKLNQLYRTNPLRRIVDVDHAINIIKASQRHNSTNYDYYLAIYHDLEEKGEVYKGYAKEFAHRTKNIKDSDEVEKILKEYKKPW